MTELIGFPKWMLVIRGVQLGCTASEIQLDTRTTYSHVVKIINALEDKKWIERVKQGRKKKIILTAKGEKIAKLATDLQKVVGK